MTGPNLAGGVVPPIATPLREDRQVDVESLRRLRDHLLRAGAAGIFALGSTGEAIYLSDERRGEVVNTLTDGSDAPVLVGVPEATAPRVIEAARAYLDLPVAAFVVTGPFYAVSSDDEVYDHFAGIAQSLPKPLLAYNIPSNVGYPLSSPLVARLIADGVVIGVKDSSGDLARFEAMAAAEHPPGALYLSGSDTTLDLALDRGANGSVAGLANVAPALFVAMLAAHAAGDRERVAGLQERIGVLARLYEPFDDGSGTNSSQLGSIKSALQLLGIIDTDQVSFPMRRASELRRARDHEVLVQAGLEPRDLV